MYDGRIFVFESSVANETEDMFIERCWYIVKRRSEESPPLDLEHLEKLSHIHVNMKFLGVRYEAEDISCS